MKKITALFLASIVALPCAFAVGCGDGGGSGTGGGKVDATKTQVYVAYMDAGFSNRWLLAVAERFEEAYAEYSFEEGKKGVEIVMDPMGSGNMAIDMGTKRSWIYFPEQYSTTEYVGSGVVADITAAMTTSLGEPYGKDVNGKELPGYAGETQSVYEKMTAQEKGYYVLDNNGTQKIYGIPYVDTYQGTLTYDADVFEKYGLYYKADNTLGGKKSTGEVLGTGPDGISGTADDGLPRTYDEFFAVCRKMKLECDTTPFTWAGNWTTYVAQLALAMAFNNMGEEQFSDIMKGEGTLRDYIATDVNEDGTYVTSEETFTETDCIQKMSHTAAVYNAVDFIYEIIKNDYAKTPEVFTASYSHELAQADFIFGADRLNDFGFLVDGTWWYNEAEKYIVQWENRGHDRKDRNVLYMALPKVNEAEFERLKGTNLVYSDYLTAACIKEGLTDMQQLLAETFLRFFCTNESLVEYHTVTSTARGLNYTMDTLEYEALTPYAKSLYNIHTSNAENGYGTYKVAKGYNASDFYRLHASSFSARRVFESETSFGVQSLPADAFYNYTSKGLTAVKYFNGIKAYH